MASWDFHRSVFRISNRLSRVGRLSTGYSFFCSVIRCRQPWALPRLLFTFARLTGELYQAVKNTLLPKFVSKLLSTVVIFNPGEVEDVT